MEISPEGTLADPGLDLDKMIKVGKSFYETDDDPRDIGNPRRLRGKIIANKNNAILGIIPKFELKDVYDRDGKKSKIPTLKISMSEAQESSGLPTKPSMKWEIDGIINEAIAAGYISPEKGEEWKREFLGILGLPGIGIVRAGAIGFEVISNPGNIFGFFWAMLTKFLSLSLPKEVGLSSR